MARFLRQFGLRSVLMGMLYTCVGIYAFNKVNQAVPAESTRWLVYAGLAFFRVYYPLARAAASKLGLDETLSGQG